MRQSIRLLTVMFGIALTASVHANGQTGQIDPPRALYTTPTGVSLADLGYVYESDDVSIGSMALKRSYASQRFDSSNYFGTNWTHNFDIWFTQGVWGGDAQVKVVIGRTIYKFYGSTTQNYPSNDETGLTLYQNSSGVYLIDRDGTSYKFNLTGSISSITSPDGEIKNFYYSSNKLKYVSSNRGNAISFDYTNGVVTSACAINLSTVSIGISTTCQNISNKVSYGYVNGSLSTVTDSGGMTSTNYYASNNYGFSLLACVTSPGTGICRVTNTYGNNGMNSALSVVRQQLLADGSLWQYDCSCGALADPVTPQDWTEVTNPTNKKSSIVWDYQMAPARRTDENSATTNFYFYGRYPGYMTDPEGNRTDWLYNGRMVVSGRIVKAKPGSGLSDLNVDTKTFAGSCSNAITCNLPLTVTDAKGAVTEFTYDSVHGGPLSEMGPAPSSGSARPLKIYSYVQKYAYIKNGGGALVPAASPVWLRSSETVCQTAAGSNVPACDAGAPQSVTSFQYGSDGTADNLLLRGATVSSGGVSLTTCYSYDSAWNKISETRPRAGLTSCP